MVLEGTVARRFFGIIYRIEVFAVCTRHHLQVENPYVGCGHCHDGGLTFVVADEPSDHT
jgi:hypothetical protein